MRSDFSLWPSNCQRNDWRRRGSRSAGPSVCNRRRKGHRSVRGPVGSRLRAAQRGSWQRRLAGQGFAWFVLRHLDRRAPFLISLHPNSNHLSCNNPRLVVQGEADLRIASTWLVALWIGTGLAWAQQVSPPSDLYQGHLLAALYCGNCHLAAPDQPYPPDRRSHAPSFESIAQREDINAQSLRTFLTTTHRGLDNPKGMPSPHLVDYQINQITAYILSLRK